MRLGVGTSIKIVWTTHTYIAISERNNEMARKITEASEQITAETILESYPSIPEMLEDRKKFKKQINAVYGLGAFAEVADDERAHDTQVVLDEAYKMRDELQQIADKYEGYPNACTAVDVPTLAKDAAKMIESLIRFVRLNS